MKRLSLLAVDDDELVHETLKLAVPESWELVPTLEPRWPERRLFHCAFVDMHLSGDLKKQEGVEVIGRIAKEHPSCEIIAISGDLSRSLMEDCLKAGASRFLAKPLAKTEVELVLSKVEAHWQLQGVGGDGSLSAPWIGSSAKSQSVRRKIAQLTGEGLPVLIEGESGTGKEIVAQLLRSQGSPRPFVSVNVAAIPKDLFESVFFGHRKGAFTGAAQNQLGLVEKAHGGDLFLDEIEALASEHQAKLLRFLESGEYRPLGSESSNRSQVRILSATNQSLDELVATGKFRKDLKFRLEGEKVSLPPLRERKEDLEELVEFFIESSPTGVRKTLSESAVEALKKHSWPGNVRELKRCVERLLVKAPLPVLRDEDVHAVLANDGWGVDSLEGDGAVVSKLLESGMGLSEILSHIEKLVLEALVEKNRDIDGLLKRLKISRSSLYKKLKDHNVSLERKV